MAVNFFMVLSPSLIQDQAQTLITSFYVSPEASAAIDRLAGEFPSLTVVNLESLLAQLRQILDQTGFAIQSLFLFSLLAGGLILVTALSVSKASRLREAGLLRALGASRQQLRQAQQLELLVLGAVAGLAAALWSQAMGWAVAQLAFDLQVGLNPARMGQLMMAGMGLAWLGGWLVLREVSSTPSMNVLRQATG
jgi:putative ABC transport system permease protein